MECRECEITLPDGYRRFITEVVSTESTTTDDSKSTLLVVHGGPGIEDSKVLVEALSASFVEHLSSEYGRVVFYDQVGCKGKSECLHDDDFFPLAEVKMFEESFLEGGKKNFMDFYVAELACVVEHVRSSSSNVGATKIVLFGHSFGGNIVLEFLLNASRVSGFSHKLNLSHQAEFFNDPDVNPEICTRDLNRLRNGDASNTWSN